MSRPSTADVVFTNARLFTGVDAEVIDGGVVWISGRHIGFAGRSEPAGDVPSGAPSGVRRVDLGGRFVMPGMTESHAHVFCPNSGRGSEQGHR